MFSRDDLREWLDPEAPVRPARLVRAWHYGAVLGGLVIASAGSVEEIWTGGWAALLVAAAIVVLAGFAVEYALRIAVAADERWVDTESVAHACRRYVQSPIGLIDLLCFLPMAALMLAGVPLQVALLASVLWMSSWRATRTA